MKRILLIEEDNDIRENTAEIPGLSNYLSNYHVILTDSPEAGKKFRQILATDITALENYLLGLAYNSLRKKVSEALIMLRKKYSTEQVEIFATNISRETGHYCGYGNRVPAQDFKSFSRRKNN
ncbi:MAG TPA: hypothetical protein VLM16_01305 [Ginsengibacter sp.]|nr:hypothetical protein [Ginsengibacter sp.]